MHPRRHRIARPLTARRRPAAAPSGQSRLRLAVRSLSLGELVYAVPQSVNEPLTGPLVDTDGVVLAIETEENGVVWVHGADCPDLARTATV